MQAVQTVPDLSCEYTKTVTTRDVYGDFPICLEPIYELTGEFRPTNGAEMHLTTIEVRMDGCWIRVHCTPCKQPRLIVRKARTMADRLDEIVAAAAKARSDWFDESKLRTLKYVVAEANEAIALLETK